MESTTINLFLFFEIVFGLHSIQHSQRRDPIENTRGTKTTLNQKCMFLYAIMVLADST